MVGTRYWSTGITVHCTRTERDEWTAEARFQDDGFCDDNASEGVVRCRYVGPLPHVVDVVKADAERLGIVWIDPLHPESGEGASKEGTATVYYRGDGEHRDIPPPPTDWRERVNAEARRFGWREAYRKPTAETPPAA